MGTKVKTTLKEIQNIHSVPSFLKKTLGTCTLCCCFVCFLRQSLECSPGLNVAQAWHEHPILLSLLPRSWKDNQGTKQLSLKWSNLLSAYLITVLVWRSRASFKLGKWFALNYIPSLQWYVIIFKFSLFFTSQQEGISLWGGLWVKTRKMHLQLGKYTSIRVCKGIYQEGYNVFPKKSSPVR